MTQHELYEALAGMTGDDLETIERLGFEIEMPHYEPDRKELKRQRRLKLWRQQRRDRHLAKIASNLTEYRQEAERVRVRFDEAVKLAEDAFLGELTKLVDHLAERISGSEDGKPKIFQDTVVTNLVEFFDRFRRLNIGSSEELDNMVADVRRIVGNTTASDLRNNAPLRQHVAGELSRVQASLDGLMVDRPPPKFDSPERRLECRS